MLEQKKKRQSYYMKREILEDLGDNPTADQVLDYLLGDQDGHRSDYNVYKYEYGKRSLKNRVNMIWVYPIFLISIPFQWLIIGEIGISKNTKIGRVVDKLVRFD